MEFKPIKEVIKETKQNMKHIYDYAIVGAEYLDCHDCNDCSRAFVCDYAPEIGELTRANCPLWTETEAAPRAIDIIYIVVQSTKEHTYIACVCANRYAAEKAIEDFRKWDPVNYYTIEAWKVRA